MIIAENLPLSRSVEHLIPNTILSVPRTKSDGDFYACRECNSRKSNLDNILAIVARAQAANLTVASRALIKALTSKKPSSERFVSILQGAEHTPDGVRMRMPFDGRELFDYITFLAKGAHFLTTACILDANHVIQIEFAAKPVMESLHDRYFAQHGSNPTVDLQTRAGTKVWGDGECVLWSNGGDHLLVLHWYLGIIMEVRPRTRRNYRRARELEFQMLRDFAPQRLMSERTSPVKRRRKP